ncbi:predicted coding region [Mycoplasmopsis pulmonis]|uniref:ABC transporter ATP-binding protein n=1 Tax=Mycoplasmopsis pulmonis (strain UAB CTIP) TaxID=272635 RepID=Q98PQ6_MYCPU|nr:hypothetical protein [Mycoplasmopsis pulmonis]MDZ7293683.1 hypothetical protein [Mycoplasmopsis pulmonis]CAC13836.1 predicted coding region [Mycoplasmopsis pulmonis]
MINSITIKSKKNNEEKEINFGKINIIVGEKGSGKSTLFQILISHFLKSQCDPLVDFLTKKNINISTIKIDDEEISLSDYTKVKQGDFDKKADKLNFISRQNDEIKTKLDNNKTIKKQHENSLDQFVDEIIEKNSLSLVDKLKEFKEKIDYFNQKSQEINWRSFWEVKNPADNIRFDPEKIDYDNAKEIGKLKNKIDVNEKLIKESKAYINILKNSKKFYEKENNKASFPFIEEEKQIVLSIEENILKIEELIKNLETYNKKLNLTRIVLDLFKRNFIIQKNEYKKEKNESEKNRLTSSKFEKFFKEQAKILVGIKKTFNEIEGYIDQKIDLNLEEKNTDLLTFKLERFVLDEEKIFDSFGIFLYKTGQTDKRLHSNWMLKNKGDKQKKVNNWKDEAEKKIIDFFVKDHVHIYAGNKKYENMSPGEKSIFGLKYKMLKNDQQYLFLDQPEDNLDNHTIKEEIVPLLIKAREENKQIFIVTHNSNIGILVNPDKVVTTNIHENDIDKIFSDSKSIKNKEGEEEILEVYYLEGGEEAIKKRMDYIKKKETIKEKHDSN